MNTKEFEALIVAGRVTRIVINRFPVDVGGWELVVFGDDLPPDMKYVIELNGNGGRRSWADLDAAYLFVRKSGYRGVVEVSDNAG